MQFSYDEMVLVLLSIIPKRMWEDFMKGNEDLLFIKLIIEGIFMVDWRYFNDGGILDNVWSM